MFRKKASTPESVMIVDQSRNRDYSNTQNRSLPPLIKGDYSSRDPANKDTQIAVRLSMNKDSQNADLKHNADINFP